MPLDLPLDHYYPFSELTDRLQQLAAAYPDLVQIGTIGKSYEGRDVWVITATNLQTGPPEGKPAFWADGNIHATEVSASAACLYLLYRLATEYGSDPDITRAMDTRAFYVVPRVNPDGAELFFALEPRYLRSSTRPYPYDEEPIEGLKPQDVDGDGRILSMRIPDPNGPWKEHTEHPRLLVRRDPTETGGAYYRLLPEGLLENWDGLTLRVQRSKEGLDLNRNFPAHWRQEFEQQGAGPFPGSEPEVYNLLKFIAAHPNITGGITFHTFGGLLLRPYGTQPDDTMPAEDLWTFQAIGRKGTELSGYPNISVFHDFRYHPREVITGVFDDWLYDHFGLYAWTVEIWSPQRQAGITEYKPIDWYREHPVEDDAKLLAWSDEKLGGRGYVDWRPFDHPQLGRIDIGGWDAQFAFRNPPLAFLQSELAPLTTWAVWHALLSPQMVIHLADAERLGDGVYRVRLVVDNVGWLPGYISKRALERKAVREVVAEIELPDGASLETGKVRTEIGQLEGRAYKDVSPIGSRADSTDTRLKVEWTVRAPAGSAVKVTARHEKAGVVQADVTLP